MWFESILVFIYGFILIGLKKTSQHFRNSGCIITSLDVIHNSNFVSCDLIVHVGEDKVKKTGN